MDVYYGSFRKRIFKNSFLIIWTISDKIYFFFWFF
jgi:hypothetical protein